NQFRVCRAHGCHIWNARVVLSFSEVFIEPGLPPWHRASFEERPPACSLHLFRRCQTSEVEERLRQVQVQDHFVTNPAATDLAESRIAQDHRNAYALLVAAALTTE